MKQKKQVAAAWIRFFRWSVALTASLFVALASGPRCHVASGSQMIYSENFDELVDGSLNGQDGWTTTGAAATVEPVEGHGNVVALAFPNSFASINIPLPESLDQFTAGVDLKFTDVASSGPGQSQKLIVYFEDAAGKILAEVYHDYNDQWGVKSGDNYIHSGILGNDDHWAKISVAFDQQAKKFDLYVSNGTVSMLLYEDVSYTDSGTGPLAQVVFRRDGQGDGGPCYIDDLNIGPTPLKPPDRLDGWLAGAPNFNIAAAGQSVTMQVEAKRVAFTAADHLKWSVSDYLGNVVKKGDLPVPAGSGTWDGFIALGNLPAGYYDLSGRFRKQGLDFERRGSEPENTVSFGVLPGLTALPLANSDDSRFGMQGATYLSSGSSGAGDPYTLYAALGAKWVNYPMLWDKLEPSHFGQFDPDQNKALGGDISYAVPHNMTLLTTTHGIPLWAQAVPATAAPVSLDGKFDSQAYPPLNYAQYDDIMTRIGRRQYLFRQTYFPTMAHNWYQISWEPDWHWKGTQQQYVEMVSHAYSALHRGDPSAEVIGPGDGVLDRTVAWLKTMLPLGLGNSLDGIATHAYYLGEGDPYHPSLPGNIAAPEDQNVIPDMREIKSLTRQYLKPGARIFQTEWGLDYKGSYSTADAELLRRMAAYTVRGHIILLGEGADTTYFFYTSDYMGECGFGLSYNLTMPSPNFGAVSVAPKPVFMAAAAMTRLLEGTKTIGPLTNLPADVYGYAFDRAGTTVVAIWKAHPGTASVSLPLADAKASLIDFMGNETARVAQKKTIDVIVNEYPVYVEGIDVNKIKLQ